MLKRFFLVALLLTAASRAAATDYTDIWYNPLEAGYGFNVVQSDTFIFMTFFVYGADNRPTWFTAQLNQDASGNFNGGLYATMGTYFAVPWIGYTGGQVGTASFQPTGPYTARLAYTVTGVATVVKNIQRQPLTPITIGGTYTGGVNLQQTGCVNSGSGTLTANLQVTQPTNNNGPVTILMSRADGFVCTFRGPITSWGKLYQMQGASYTCSNNGRNTTATIDELEATAHGIEGTWVAQVENGCTETGTFSAVLH